MNISNTSCEECYFAKEATAEQPCAFYIPEVISNSKKIDIINKYHYINNYRCKYGVSKKTAESILKENENLDIKSYARQHISPKYFLFCIISPKDDLALVCDNINRLEIKPKALSIVFTKDCDIKEAQKICDIKLQKKYSWKLHYFLEPKENHELFSICTSTDDRYAKCHFVWIVNNEILDYGIKQDSINKINFIINVEQPDIGILNSRLSMDYFNGIFLTIENIKGIYTHIDHDIGKAIKETYRDDIGYYD